MPSTVIKRWVVYILAKRVRSHTVSLKFLWILLNKGCNILMKSMYAHDVIDVLSLSVYWRL